MLIWGQQARACAQVLVWFGGCEESSKSSIQCYATLHLGVKKRFQKYQFFASKSQLSTEMKFASAWKSIKEWEESSIHQTTSCATAHARACYPRCASSGEREIKPPGKDRRCRSASCATPHARGSYPSCASSGARSLPEERQRQEV
jgi:hypothetical protein